MLYTSQFFDNFETETNALVLRHNPCIGARSSYYIPKNNITSIGYVRDFSMFFTMLFAVLIIISLSLSFDEDSNTKREAISMTLVSSIGIAWQLYHFFVRKIMIHAGSQSFAGKFDNERCTDLLQWFQNSLSLSDNIV